MAVQQYNNSTSANSTRYFWPYVAEPYSIEILRLTFVSAMAFFGFVCNVLVFIQISRRRQPSPVALYVRNLAIADLGILCNSVPIAIIREQMPMKWPLGVEMCHVVYPLTEVFHGVSVWSIVAIAVERYRSMHRLSQTAARTKLTSVRYRLAAMWVLSFIVTAFPLFFIMKHKQNSDGTYCFFDWPPGMQHTYVGILTILGFFLPMAIIIFSYIYISRVIQRSNRFHRRSIKTFEKYIRAERKYSTTEARRLKENARARKILTPLVLVFAITMLPLNVLRVIALAWTATTQWRYFLVIYNLSVIAIVFNCVADPIIYSIVTKDFLRSLLKRRFSSLSVSSPKGRRRSDAQQEKEHVPGQSPS